MSEYIKREDVYEWLVAHLPKHQERIEQILNDVPNIDIDDYIPIEYIKDFCKDCADEGIGTVSTYMEDAGEAIVKSWLAVKDTDFGKKYKR